MTRHYRQKRKTIQGLGEDTYFYQANSGLVSKIYFKKFLTINKKIKLNSIRIRKFRFLKRKVEWLPDLRSCCTSLGMGECKLKLSAYTLATCPRSSTPCLASFVITPHSLPLTFSLMCGWPQPRALYCPSQVPELTCPPPSDILCLNLLGPQELDTHRPFLFKPHRHSRVQLTTKHCD